MARSLRSRITTDAPPDPWVGFDGASEWRARRLQPHGLLVPGSKQPLVVEVQAPIILDEQRVQMQFADVWRDAEWLGEPGYVRQAILNLVTVAGQAGHLRVRVQASKSMEPILDVGFLRVRSR